MFKAPRGTVDILPDEQPLWHYVDLTTAEVCSRFGYSRIDTPIFEASGLFHRTVGETTDIVEKETYSLSDRNGDSITLRPEGTAGVCRAYLEHGMHVLPQPVRLYSSRVPMFRYDRPQKGRQRQFHQIFVEAIGEADATLDAEVIELAWRLFESLGMRDLTLAMNSIGDPESRPKYLDTLRRYYEPLLGQLCSDCQRRYSTNLLRLLDCKKPACHIHTSQAPDSISHLSGSSLEHWNQLTAHLRSVGLNYTIDHRLVRGLDYYTRTVFEIYPPADGAQAVLCGGGRYDQLMEQLGGRPTPGVGFAAGVERILLNLKQQAIQMSVTSEGPVAVVVFTNSNGIGEATRLASQVRRAGISAITAPPGKSFKAQMRYVDAVGGDYALILGEDEIKQGIVGVKNMQTGDQRDFPVQRVTMALQQHN